MEIKNVVQGSDEWLALRSNHPTASEASAMMGASKNVSRSELLRMKATGSEKEYSDWVLKNLFEKGHEIEAMARPFAEKIIGEDLYPATAIDDEGYLLSSYDGLTMMESVCWECKSWNEQKAAAVRDGSIPDEDYWQVIQQLSVGADKCLYMVTDGTEEKTVYVWKELTGDDYKSLMAGWAQFADDLANYTPVDVEPEVVGKTPETLPALHIELSGMVKASNLIEFKSTAMSVIDAVNTELQTDLDFATAEKAVKWCKDVETRLVAAKDHALGQTASIDELFRTLDEIKEEARTKRLELERLVKARKQSIRDEILMGAKQALSDHIATINAGLGGKIQMPVIQADFAGAMKGKKTVTSLHDAVDTELARVKIESNQLADKIRINLESLRADAVGYESLFADAQQLVTKDNDDLKNLIAARIAEHKAEEEKRLDSERERIRKEEVEKLKIENKVNPSTEVEHEKAQEEPVNKNTDAGKISPTQSVRLFTVSAYTEVKDAEIMKVIGDALLIIGVRARVFVERDKAA